VLVGHVSMHGAVLNSAAMRESNITAETRTPPGGVILRKPGSNEPVGLARLLPSIRRPLSQKSPANRAISSFKTPRGPLGFAKTRAVIAEGLENKAVLHS